VKTAGLDDAADSSNATAAAAKSNSLMTLRSRLDARHARPGGGGADEVLCRGPIEAWEVSAEVGKPFAGGIGKPFAGGIGRCAS
jgi:hypothetical protein